MQWTTGSFRSPPIPLIRHAMSAQTADCISEHSPLSTGYLLSGSSSPWPDSDMANEARSDMWAIHRCVQVVWSSVKAARRLCVAGGRMGPQLRRPRIAD